MSARKTFACSGPPLANVLKSWSGRRKAQKMGAEERGAALLVCANCIGLQKSLGPSSIQDFQKVRLRDILSIDRPPSVPRKTPTPHLDSSKSVLTGEKFQPALPVQTLLPDRGRAWQARHASSRHFPAAFSSAWRSQSALL